MQDHGRDGLTVGDGFKFGCGFILAAVVFNVVVFTVLAILALVSTLLGLAIALPQFQ